MQTETHLKPTKKNQELEQSQVFVVLCQEWPRCCARNSELKSVVCLGLSSRLKSCSVVLARSLMQVRKGQNLGVVRQALSCVASPDNCAITLLKPVTRLHGHAILFIHEKARRVNCTSQQCATLPLLLVWSHTHRRDC